MDRKRERREEAGKRRKRTVAVRTLHYYWRVTRIQLPMFLASVIVTLGYVFLLMFANPLIVGRIVDTVSAGGIGADDVIPVFGPYIVTLFLVNVIGQACSKLQDYTCARVEIRASYELGRTAFDALCNQSMTFHTNRFGGSLVSSTQLYIAAYSQLMDVFAYGALPSVAAVVFTIVLLVPLVPVYVALLSVVLVIYVIIIFRLYRRILPVNTAASAAKNRLSGELSDSITNILAVKTAGREDFEQSLFEQANRAVCDTDSRRMVRSLLTGSVSSALIVVMMTLVAVFIAGGAAWFGISAGTLVMMFTYTNTITNHFNMLSRIFQRINHAFGDAHDLTIALDEPRLVDDVPDAADLVIDRGEIDFCDVSFSYPDAGADDPVFRGFTLDIPSGQRVGLVGRSGSGKTTLTSLLLRLADLTSGSIRIDGQDIAAVNQVSLRRSIAYVPQEPLLFHRTIRENISYGRPEASPEEIEGAAREANATEFIRRLPEGMDTQVGERGVKLSGGQRQRIAIARAILMDAPILVLDEATSALDSESERLIQSALENLMRGRTSLVIAHRLSTVAALDRIVVLSDGVIVEDGTHSDLVRAGGEYARLWSRQTGAFLGGQ
ncbi:ABC transporter related protein [Coriobacterium glomerans PW2]|uniref:ABC transporter related protein n=1 Tax=Coriobacterium glomerans (strain ATCC 49209 / DSM 20642 / JCM 10262 / PW2) TaxID=700015 RepID=F2N8S2_CORGP|nr:ABC transporter ATP-binding protein [Coriobacterium glomerans]AEB07455.1 ABC transporter related protein [Coriobacterium glomerans PW2]